MSSSPRIPGQRPWRMGDMNEAMILGCLAGVEAALTLQGIPFGRGGVSAAVDFLARDAG